MDFQRIWLSVLCWSTLFLLPCAAQSADDASPLQVRYYFGGTTPDYAVKLLKLALDKSQRAYELIEVQPQLTTSRIIKMVEDQDAVGPNIYWAAYSRELEQRLAAIYFPIDRGLISYRILVIEENTQHKLSRVHQLADLLKFSFVQGFEWSDTRFLRTYGMRVEEGLPQNLYPMLAHNRGDVFPRSILDVQREFVVWGKNIPQLRIEKDIALLYESFMVFFFVNKANAPLQAAIDEGLKKAFDDGSFMQLFLQDSDVASALKLLQEKRRVIRFPASRDNAIRDKIPSRYIDQTIRQMGW